MANDLLYEQYKKLLYSISWYWTKRTSMEFEDLLAEFNLVFCEALIQYDPKQTKFSTFLTHCCNNRMFNNIKKYNCKKRLNEQIGFELDPVSEYTPEDQFLIFDSFVNNENEVIQSIAGIISTYKLPKHDFRRWLIQILKSYGFKWLEILEAFKLLKTITESK